MNNKDEGIAFREASQQDFQDIYREMQKSFIPEEIRDKDEALEILNDPDYKLLHIIKSATRVGFISLWRLKSTTFVEHLVVYERYRNLGMGAAALEALAATSDNIVLEAEHPISDIQKRRIGFYKRCGFRIIDEDYLQPPYRKEDDGVPLLLLARGEAGEPYKIKEEIYAKIYGVEFREGKIIRKGGAT